MNATLLTKPTFQTKPTVAVKTVLVVSQDEVFRQLLGQVIRNDLNCEVFEAASVAEGRRLTFAEGNINLVLVDTASEENLEFAHWFFAIHPESTVLVADDSMWELADGPDACQKSLVATSYTLDELVSNVRRLLSNHQLLAH